MVEQITFQTIFQFLQTVGILVGIGYYITTIRNQQKNQKITTETRQIQYFLQQNRDIIQSLPDTYQEVVSLQWENFDDFIEKYGIVNNPEIAKKRLDIWRTQNIAGLMIRDGLLDVQTYMYYIGDAPIQIWNKYKDIIIEFRRVFEFPIYMEGMEYLATELDKLRIEKGWGPKGEILYANPSNS